LYRTEDLIPAPRCSSTTTLLLVGVVWLVSSCSPKNPAAADPKGLSDEEIVSVITMNHTEIRRDILAELHKHEIQYWINEDRSIGFPADDAETIDSIYYEVVGAYAARN
jgi:hypothetical protein